MKPSSSSRKSVSPQRASPKNGNTEQYSTPIKIHQASNYTFRTPTKRQSHPEGWEKITWAPKPCRKAVRRMNFEGALAMNLEGSTTAAAAN